MESLSALDAEDTKLIQDMGTFEKEWRHRKPCGEFMKTGYCDHLERAKGRKFKRRVGAMLSVLPACLNPSP